MTYQRYELMIMETNKAIETVRQQAFSDVVACPVCGYRSNGRILSGNFSGWRDTRVNAVVRHIRRLHAVTGSR